MREMTILCNNIVGICGNSAIHKLVIILIEVGKEMEAEIRLSVDGLRMTSNRLNYIMSHFRRGVFSKNLLIFSQDIVADTQTIFPLQKVRPYLMVTALGG